MKFNQKTPRNQSYEMNKRSVLPTLPQGQVKISTVAAELNLQGPFVCRFSSREATVSGYVKDTKIYGQIEESINITHFLLNDNCAYSWKNNRYEGEKWCGIGSYVSMIKKIPFARLLQNNQLISVFGNSNKIQSMVPVKMDDVSNVLNSCKKEEIKNNDVFKVPKNVFFKEKKIF